MKTYYGFASRSVNETIALYETREEAEQAVRTVLEKAPELAGDALIVEIELEEPSLN